MSNFRRGDRVNVGFLNIAGYGPGYLPGVIVTITPTGLTIQVTMPYGETEFFVKNTEDILPETLIQTVLPHKHTTTRPFRHLWWDESKRSEGKLKIGPSVVSVAATRVKH